MESTKSRIVTLEGGVLNGMAKKEIAEGEKNKKGKGNGRWGGHDRYGNWVKLGMEIASAKMVRVWESVNSNFFEIVSSSSIVCLI